MWCVMHDKRHLLFYLQEVYTFSHNMVKIGDDVITELHMSGKSHG